MPKRRVLVVEDDRDIRGEMVSLLEEEGYSVLVADHGRHALEVIQKSGQPDVIVLDLMMPVMDGWEFRELQKRDPALCEIPVIVTTASEDEVDADALIPKPIDGEALLRAIKAL